MTDTLHLDPDSEDADETKPAELTLEEQIERLDAQQLSSLGIVVAFTHRATRYRASDDAHDRVLQGIGQLFNLFSQGF